MRISNPLFALSVAALQLGAQERLTVLRGTVISAAGPVPAANVFLIETLEGAVSDSAGRWSFTTARTASALLVVKANGFQETRRTIELPSQPVTILLKRATQSLASTTVVASRYAAGDERGATLTAIDVVSTPGTNADVMRAIQTLPGAQQVDEGTGLYVRGGDYTETQVRLNDAVMPTAFTYESPNGTFIGTVDPFLLDGIYFSSGGFGARYGNVLSGLAALNSMGRPQRPSATIGAGLAALSVAGAVSVNKELSLRVAANEFDTDLLFRVNGATVKYDTPPRGHDRTGSVIWNYRPTGELKLFAIGQATNLKSIAEQADYSGSYAFGIASQLLVANWRDVFSRWSPSVRVSDTRMDRSQDYGAFRLQTGQRFSGASAQVDFAPTDGLTLRAGAEFERITSRLDGSIPDFGFEKAPGARVTLVGATTDGDRIAEFAEADMVVGRRTRLVAGMRRDAHSLTGGETLDPRVSTAITIIPGVVFTAAWGVYHQVPDPISYDSTVGAPGLPSMRATHSIAGIQAGSAGQMVRLEFFDKRYSDLSQVTRDYNVTRDGVGSSRGFDLFIAGSGLPGMRWRTSLSAVTARRTDPNTGVVAAAPFDVTRSLTTVVNQSFGPAWHLGLTWRLATGRPFTPVTGASYDSTNAVFVPQYGASMSQRLPDFHRLDFGLTNLRRVLGANVVLYAGLSNALDRSNVFAYRYTPDYSTRIPIRSLFNRSYYVGTSIATS